jgi:hypothetical protein
MTTVMPMGPARVVSDDFGRRTDKLVVRADPGTYVTIRLFTMFVAPGDTLVITGEMNLTNNTGRNLAGAVTGTRYDVGIAASLWIYDANAPADLRPATWLRLGTNGENVTVDGHHIEQGLTRAYRVPDTWDPTHQIGIVLRVDAHSTAAGSNTTPDYVLVETHGVLMAMHYPLVTPADPAVVALQQQVTALAAQVAALTPQEV